MKYKVTDTLKHEVEKRAGKSVQQFFCDTLYSPELINQLL